MFVLKVSVANLLVDIAHLRKGHKKIAIFMHTVSVRVSSEDLWQCGFFLVLIKYMLCLLIPKIRNCDLDCVMGAKLGQLTLTLSGTPGFRLLLFAPLCQNPLA